VKIVIDSSVLVGLLNSRDHWHSHTMDLFAAMQSAGTELLYFDCVIAESVSAILRRLAEQDRLDEVERLFERLNLYASQKDITWALPEVPFLYADILSLMQTTNGELNFHDALIAIICRNYNISAIASYDADFDLVSWLHRISKPEDLIMHQPS